MHPKSIPFFCTTKIIQSISTNNLCPKILFMEYKLHNNGKTGKKDIMKHSIPYIIASIFMFCSSLLASELSNVSRVDNRDIVQLYFSFDKVPAFSMTVNEKRINLIFQHTQTLPDLKIFEADGNIVKILPLPKSDEFVLSLFFRYKPQYHRITKSKDDKIVFEVLLGNQFSKSYKDLADRLKGLTVLDRSPTDSTNPYLLSPYTSDWISFFSEYESPVTIEIPLKFSFIPFPAIHLLPVKMHGDSKILSEEMLKLAAIGNWGQLADQISEKLQIEPDLTRKKMLGLTYGEVLARANDFEGAFKQFYLLNEKFPEELIGNFAEYLLILTRAIHEDPYTADLEFRNLEKKISITNPLTPYLHLSMIETALATSQHKRMNRLLLQDNIALPERIEKIKRIRQADYWFAIKQPIKAYVAYGLLNESSSLLQTQPYSMYGNCTTLYDHKRFQDSAKCYEQLSSLTLSKKNKGLIQYRENMARLKFQSATPLIKKFSQIKNTLPTSESVIRAALKETDLILLQDKSRSRWALNNYLRIGNNSILRITGEEALFKQALIHSILGQNSKSIVLLQKLLREYRYGNITTTAQALLIEILPQEIKKLTDKKHYLEALVLAKQNKSIFQNNWISSKYLVDIAGAYSNIGINNEAQQLYLYLIEIVPIGEKEKFYLPMITAAFNYGNYALVENYASQYTYNYPQGKFDDEVLFFRLQSLIYSERIQEALQLLPSPIPEKTYPLAAALYYRTEAYDRCVNMFQLVQSDTPLSQEEQIMYGESLFKTGHLDEAEKIFLQITKENSFFAQSLYRLAELERKKGQEENALILFKKIVETGTNPLWQQYAQKELLFADADARM